MGLLQHMGITFPRLNGFLRTEWINSSQIYLLSLILVIHHLIPTGGVEPRGAPAHHYRSETTVGVRYVPITKHTVTHYL